MLAYNDESLSQTAKMFGVTIEASRRHVACTVWPAGAASPPGALAARVGRLEAQARKWHDEAEKLLADARKDPMLRGLALERGLKAIAASKSVLELAGKLTGELTDAARVETHTHVTAQVLVASPEWAALRVRLVEALGPYPEARAAVLRALAGGEDVPALTEGGAP